MPVNRSMLVTLALWAAACGGTSTEAGSEQTSAPARPSKANAPASVVAKTPADPEPVPAAKPEPAPDPDDVLYLRIGPKDQAAVYEGGVQFDPATPLVGEFKIGAQSYSYRLVSKPASPGSMYKTRWDLRFYRGAPEDDDQLARTILGNPAEEKGGGGCNKLTDYASSDNLWIEIGIRGTERTAKEACAGLMKPR